MVSVILAFRSSFPCQYQWIFLLALLLCTHSSPVFAQSDSLKIFDWQEHFSYKNFYDLSSSETALYATSNVGLIKWNLETMEATKFSKINGLSDIKPTFINYFKSLNALVIIYENSNIDIVYPHKVVNVPDILQNGNLLGRKGINHILALEEEGEKPILWISGEFGVTILDIEEGIFINSILLEDGVEKFQYANDEYFLISGQNYYNFKDQNLNAISDFSNWTLLAEQYPSAMGINGEFLKIIDDQIYLGNKDKIYGSSIGSDSFQLIFDAIDSLPVKALYTIDGDLAIMDVDENNFNFSAFHLLNGDADSVEIERKIFNCSFNVSDLEQIGDSLFFGNSSRSLFLATDRFTCHEYNVNSPDFEYAYDIEYQEGKLYATPGGATREFIPTHSGAIHYAILDAGSWQNHNVGNTDFLQDHIFRNIMEIEAIPESEDYYVASYYDGLVRVRPEENTYDLYQFDNSCLQNVSGTGSETRVAGLTLDDELNLWLTNYFAEEPLSSISDDGACTNAAIGRDYLLGKVITDLNGLVWAQVVPDNQYGLLVYDPETKQKKLIGEGNSGLLDNNVQSLEVDRNGVVWVGSASGVTQFSCGQLIFEKECGSVPGVSLDGDNIGDGLLMDQYVTCIAIDGGNRKWFGTQNGIFVQSDNIRENVYTFNKENSPLPSNFINDISVDHESGEVFVATDVGIVSFLSDATEAPPYHRSIITSYPNPVRPNYEGPIVLQGLAENAKVKITDQRGYVVAELFARGGQAIWDAKNHNGQRVASGVYLIFSQHTKDPANINSAVGKIMVIR